MPTDKYPRGISKDVETGALVHAPSATELAGWRVRRTLLGLTLLAVGVMGVYLGAMGLSEGPDAGGGATLTSMLTLLASVAVGFFGVRYLALGLMGRGVTLYERAVEADFFTTYGLVPRRRTVPLLRMHISGSARLTYGQAITTTGHAFRLPPDLVERSDLWYLGSLGTRPLAPGGREAKEAYARGELRPYEREPLPEIVDQGPPWPRMPSAERATDEVVVSVPDIEAKPPERTAEGGGPFPAGPPPTTTRVPAPIGPPTVPPGPPVAAPTTARRMRVTVPEPPPASPPEASPGEVMVDLPDSPEEVEEGPAQPTPPRARPFRPTPPAGPAVEATGPAGPPTVPPEDRSAPGPSAGDWELEEVPPPGEARDRPEEQGPPPAGSSDWELEELPPPAAGDEGSSKPSSEGEWEEL